MALSHALMTALLDEDLTGYELRRRFDTSLGFFWAASHQQIYQELRKLAEAGLLTARDVPQDGRPDKIVYALTDAGRDALAEFVAGETRRKPSKDDLFVKLYNLGHADPEPVRAELARRREEHAARLALYERIRSRHYAEPDALPLRRRGIYLALDAGIRTEAMYVDWCDDALRYLAVEQDADEAR